MMADLLQLQYYLSEAAQEMATLPVEHWECWIVQLISDLDKSAAAQGQSEAFRELLNTVNKDIDKFLSQDN
jgi:hypothetical protein